MLNDDDLGQVARADLADHVADRRELGGGVGMRGVDDVDDHVRLPDLLERRAERLDELVRQVAHEPDGVGEREHAAVGRAAAAHRRVEGREQRVLDEHAGAA